MPLRKLQLQSTRDAQTPVPGANAGQAMGVLYVDSRFASRDISSVSKRNSARHRDRSRVSWSRTPAWCRPRKLARRYQQELSIAAQIQQRLLAVTLPEVPFARVMRAQPLLQRDRWRLFRGRQYSQMVWRSCWRMSAAKESRPHCSPQSCRGWSTRNCISGMPLR